MMRYKNLSVKKILVLALLIVTIAGLSPTAIDAQKRYHHFRRVKVLPPPTIEGTATATEHDFTESETEEPITIEVETLPHLNIQEEVEQSATVLEVVSSQPIPVKQTKGDKEKIQKRKTIFETHHKPQRTYIDSDELDTMAYISLVAFITFLGAVFINFFLGGFSTIVIVFIVLSGVFAVATAVFFILANTIGE